MPLTRAASWRTSLCKCWRFPRPWRASRRSTTGWPRSRSPAGSTGVSTATCCRSWRTKQVCLTTFIFSSRSRQTTYLFSRISSSRYSLWGTLSGRPLEAERPRAFLYPLAGRFGLRRKPDESPCSESERRAPLPWLGLPEGALPEGLLSFHLPLRPVLELPRELPPRSGRSSRRNPPPCPVVLAPAPSEEPLSLTLPPRSELSARPDLPDLRNPLRTYLS